jgi:hypothetical protein
MSGEVPIEEPVPKVNRSAEWRVENRPNALHRLVQRLVENEVITEDEAEAIL